MDLNSSRYCAPSLPVLGDGLDRSARSQRARAAIQRLVPARTWHVEGVAHTPVTLAQVETVRIDRPYAFCSPTRRAAWMAESTVQRRGRTAVLALLASGLAVSRCPIGLTRGARNRRASPGSSICCSYARDYPARA